VGAKRHPRESAASAVYSGQMEKRWQKTAATVILF
jgi:hypothetical protein